MKKGYRRRYREVVARGCGGYEYDTTCGTEYGCHFYDWECDTCPIVIEQMKRRVDTVEDLIELIMEFNYTPKENE